LNDLAILQPFEKKVLQAPPNADLAAEMRGLAALEKQTILKYTDYLVHLPSLFLFYFYYLFYGFLLSYFCV
jgi:hypothetical protein